jgi:hypothetical protein
MNFLEEQLLRLTNQWDNLIPGKDLGRLTRFGINKALKDLNIGLENHSHDLLVNSCVGSNSRASYLKHYRGLFDFLARLGDYRSMILFHNKKTRNIVESMNATNIAMFMLYKTQNHGVQLRCPVTNQTVNDLFGTPMLCAGDWNDYGNVEQFLTAITNLHRTIAQSSMYSEPCQKCIDLLKYRMEKGQDCTGCEHHQGEYKFYRRGNPRGSPVVKSTSIKCKKLCENHVKNKCSQILPSEMQKLRVMLCSSNTLQDYQLYVMALVATNLFLRYDEIVKLKHEDFLFGCSKITERKNVINMVFKVKGKRDTTHKLLVLWRCDDVPTLCPVRHLLLYLHVRGITNGFIFPSMNENKKFGYHEFSRLIAKKFLPILGYKRKLTTHLFRKTGYLFAVFGGGSFDIIRVAARHKSADVALEYYDDALTLKNMAEDNGVINSENRVQKWQPSYLLNTENAINLNTAMYGYRNVALLDLAESWAAQLCGFSDIATIRANLSSCINLMHEKGSPISIFERVQSVIKDYPTHDQIQILDLFKQATSNQVGCPSCSRRVNVPSLSLVESCPEDMPKQAHHQEPSYETYDKIPNYSTSCILGISSVEELNNVQHKSPPLPSNKRQMLSPPLPSNKRQISTLSTDLPDRKKLRTNKDPKERLKIILDLYDVCATITESKTRGKKLSGTARTLYNNVLRPVKNCLTNHYCNDPYKFLDKWGDRLSKDYSRFMWKCCTGKGNKCIVRSITE